jgi:hypothetical protein
MIGLFSSCCTDCICSGLCALAFAQAHGQAKPVSTYEVDGFKGLYDSVA